MIKITIPNNNIYERKYIINILFYEFLGLNYIIDIGSRDYEILLSNKTKLIIEDTFFNKYSKDLEYLKYENIPNSIDELDIFSLSFFMLTRWEEYVNKTRDNHNRFPLKESLAYKEGFLDRPIVNEKLEILKAKLLKLDNSLEFKYREYKLILTHDVDHIYKWDTPKKVLRHLLGDIILRKSFKSFLSTLINYIKVKIGKKRDPFDTFDYLMDISDRIGIKSYFFFMAKGTSKYDNNYKSSHISILELSNKIKNRKHHIGIHSSYNSYIDKKQLKLEKLELEKNLDTTIKFGRGHYLRFDLPTTWEIWENNNMSWDSSLCYADREGFRCGVCYEYSTFNILAREQLTLKEKPLIVMEESVTRRDNISALEMENIILDLINKVKKYRGEFVFLWHNSSFNTEFWDRYKMVYENVLFRSIN